MIRSTRVVKMDPSRPSAAGIEEAVRVLRAGGLVAFPTETVYGLAAAYNNEEAMDKLYAVKGRPRDKACTVHIAGPEEIDPLNCDLTPIAERLIKKFWPGPVTIILKNRKNGTTGFRMPDGGIAKALIEKCGFPIVAPSANISGRPAPADAGEVIRELGGKIEMIIDGGPSRIGTASTVVDASSGMVLVLREGAVPRSEIEDVLRSQGKG